MPSPPRRRPCRGPAKARSKGTSIMSVVRRETMRIAGQSVGNGRVIEVHNPWDGSLVGTVPKATVAEIRQAFDQAAAYKATLTRHQRATILHKTAAILEQRKAEISELITAESGLCKKDTLYEVGRAFDVFTMAGQLCLVDDAQTFSCDISPHGKKRRHLTP